MPTALNLLALDGTEAVAPGSGTSGTFAAGKWTWSTAGGNYVRERTIDHAAGAGMTFEVEFTGGSGDYSYVDIMDAALDGLSLRLYGGAELRVVPLDGGGDDGLLASQAVSPTGPHRLRIVFNSIGNPDGFDIEYSANSGGSWTNIGNDGGVLDRGDFAALTTLRIVNYQTTASSSVEIIEAAAATPTIALDDATKDFTATAGGSNPAAQVVNITNSGAGTLDNLTRSISYVSGSGWLTATLNTTTAPATLTLQPATGALAAGTYEADVEIDDDGDASNSPQVVTVTFTVGAAAPATFPRQFWARTTPRTAADAAIAGRPIAWTSTDPAMATVTPSGLVTQLAAGGSIVATVRSGTRIVSVTTALPTT